MSNRIEYTVGTNRIDYVDYYNESRGFLIFNFDDYSVTPDQLKEYLKSLNDHIAYVREAGERIGVDKQQLKWHDTSKFSLEELPYYARNFFGDKQDPDGFASAWLHHIHANPHHPEHWRFPGNFSYPVADIVNGCLQMPHWFLMEHVADLMGASMAYTGSWDLSDWLSKNMARMYYHPDTAATLRGKLDSMGYADVIFSHRFGHEGVGD